LTMIASFFFESFFLTLLGSVPVHAKDYN